MTHRPTILPVDFNGALEIHIEETAGGTMEPVVYRYVVNESDPAVCEGCGYDTDDADVLGVRRMYLRSPLSHDDAILDYCQRCLDTERKAKTNADMNIHWLAGRFGDEWTNLKGLDA